MKVSFFMSVFAGALLLGSAALALSVAGRGEAAPKPACLTRPMDATEMALAELHTPWRYLYVPGSDPSNPLLGSATLRATALGLAHDLATGEVTAADITKDYLAERAIACGYPESIAVGGRGVATGTKDAQTALILMTSEQWGPAAGIRVPAYVDGLPMRCIGLAHASEGSGDGWIIIIMAGEGPTCPQGLSAAVEPYDGGTPTATPSPPFVRPTKTPTPTPSATPTKAPTVTSHKLFIGVAKD